MRRFKASGGNRSFQSDAQTGQVLLRRPFPLTGHVQTLQAPQVLDGHLQDVRLLQFGVSAALESEERSSVSAGPAAPARCARAAAYVFLQRVQDEALQLRQALVDARASALLHDGFGGLQEEREDR